MKTFFPDSPLIKLHGGLLRLYGERGFVGVIRTDTVAARNGEFTRQEKAKRGRGRGREKPMKRIV